MDNLKYTNLITNIKYYRFKNNITQEQLAELADLSVSYIKQIESCKTFKNVSFLTLIKISNAFNITLSDLLKDSSKIEV